jgi:hypothetical protein
MKAYGGVDVYIHIFFTSTLVGGEWSASRPSRFTPGERAPGTHWVGGWVGPRASLDDVEKRKFLTLPGLELRLLGRPASNQSLYRLRYPGSLITVSDFQNLVSIWASHKVRTVVDTNTKFAPIPNSIKNRERKTKNILHEFTFIRSFRILRANKEWKFIDNIFSDVAKRLFKASVQRSLK